MKASSSFDQGKVVALGRSLNQLGIQESDLPHELRKAIRDNYLTIKGSMAREADRLTTIWRGVCASAGVPCIIVQAGTSRHASHVHLLDVDGPTQPPSLPKRAVLGSFEGDGNDREIVVRRRYAAAVARRLLKQLDGPQRSR